MQGSLTDGLSARGLAVTLAAALQHMDGPLTGLLEDLAGWLPGTLRFRRGAYGDDCLHARMAARLGGPGPFRFRSGHLSHGGLPACWVSLCWCPSALPGPAALALELGDVPFGTLLPRARRTDRLALAVAGPAVDCSAVMTLDGQPAAVAAERITPQFLAAVSSRHGTSPGRRADTVLRHRAGRAAVR